MNVDNKQPQQPAAATSAPSKRKKKNKNTQTQAAKAGGSPASGGPTAFKDEVVRNRDSSDQPASRFAYVLGPQHKALHNYLKTVFDPKNNSYGVPASTGGFELYTKTWRTSDAGVAIAGSNGVAFIGVTCDSWIEDGNNAGNPDPTCSVLGYTSSGAGTVASNSAVTAYTGIGVGANSAVPATQSSTPLVNPLDANFTALTRMRLVAVELEVKTILPQDTAKGEIMLVSTVNPRGGVEGGTLNTATWANLINTPSGVISRAKRNIPGWKTDQVFSVVAIPAEPQAFDMVYRDAAYTLNLAGSVQGTFNLAMLARGMGAGDQIEYEVTYVWESELAKTKEAMERLSPVVDTPQSTLFTALSKSRPYSAGKMAGIHALPFVETLSQVEPNAALALSRHPARPKIPSTAIIPLPAPVAKPVIQTKLYQEPAPSDQSFLGKLGAIGKGIVHAADKSGLLEKIPYIGGALQSAADWLDGIFN